MTLAIYGIGYIARMTRASMVEVMTQQYIRTARLKGLSFGNVVVKHALRNALIAPFTVIMLQFPWLLTGVVIVEVMFRYQGFGYTLVEAAGNNDIDLSARLLAGLGLHRADHAADLRCRLRLSQSTHPRSVGRQPHAARISSAPSRLSSACSPASGRCGWRWPSCWSLAFNFRKHLGLYGQLFDSGVGIAGVGICFFWLFTAISASKVAPFDPLSPDPDHEGRAARRHRSGGEGVYLFGGDKLARDVFSRMVFGSQIVLIIAPAATAFALMVGITLGLPAGYYGGRIDSFLSFLANLVLAFPVILLFYLLVTPGIIETADCRAGWRGCSSCSRSSFSATLFYTRFKNRPERLYLLLGLTILIGGWVYVGLVFDADPLGVISIARTSSTSSWPWCSPRRRACSASCAGW
jgi:ABC-type dipeptide/oligopeptide/nickel transport system permease subunit